MVLVGQIDGTTRAVAWEGPMRSSAQSWADMMILFVNTLLDFSGMTYHLGTL